MPASIQCHDGGGGGSCRCFPALPPLFGRADFPLPRSPLESLIPVGRQRGMPASRWGGERAEAAGRAYRNNFLQGLHCNVDSCRLEMGGERRSNPRGWWLGYMQRDFPGRKVCKTCFAQSDQSIFQTVYSHCRRDVQPCWHPHWLACNMHAFQCIMMNILIFIWCC